METILRELLFAGDYIITAETHSRVSQTVSAAKRFGFAISLTTTEVMFQSSQSFQSSTSHD